MCATSWWTSASAGASSTRARRPRRCRCRPRQTTRSAERAASFSILGEQDLALGQSSSFLILTRDKDQESMRHIIMSHHLRRRQDRIVGVGWLAIAHHLAEEARKGGTAGMAGGGAGEKGGEHRERGGFARVA